MDTKILSDRQIESLRQYADAARMRPAEYPVKWRDVPTSQGDFDRLSEDDKEFYLAVAKHF